MTRLRLLPLVMVAIAALLALKTVGLAVKGGFVVAAISPARAQAQSDEATHSLGGQEPAASGSAATAAADGAPGGRDVVAAPQDGGRLVNPGQDVTGAKAAILTRLGERRGELDEREKQLDMRENLLKAAEKRFARKVAELREIEDRILAVVKKQDDERKAQLTGLVTMYESMKPKDAARIFNQLEVDVLVDLVEQLNARKMAEILANMDNGAAERLTLAIVSRGRSEAVTVTPDTLPKISNRDPG